MENVDISKQYNLILDTKLIKPLKNKELYVCKSNDSITFNINITEDENPKNLTGCSIQVLCSRTDNEGNITKIQQRQDDLDGSITITSEVNGSIKVAPKSIFTSIQSTLLCELIISDLNQNIITQSFVFRVLNSISGDISESVIDDIITLEKLHNVLKEYETELTTIEDKINQLIDKISNTEIDNVDLIDYYKKTETYSKEEINGKIPTKNSELANDSNFITLNDIDTSKEHEHTNKTVLDNITSEKVTNYDSAYNHSQSTHAPSNADENVQSDWNVSDVNSDAFIKNKPTVLKGDVGTTPNIQIGTVTTLEPTENAMVTRVGTDENPIFNFSIPKGADGIGENSEIVSSGEKLVVRYVHQGNQEIYFSSIDYTTGIATCTEPHGIIKKTEIMIVPNDWTLENFKNNIQSVPIEYTKNTDPITVTNISDTELLIAKKDGTTLIPVNLSEISNDKIDATKFHFEIPIPFKIENIQGNINYFRLTYIGYMKSAGQYRYTDINTEDEYGNGIFIPYINHYSLPLVINANTTHCIFGHLNQIYDMRECSAIIYNDSLVFGRRIGYSSIVWDYGRENTPMFLQYPKKVKRITSIFTYGNIRLYSYLSNNTIVSLYDLGGI